MLFSLKYINVAMLTILKNVANVLTASGETYFFKKQHGTQVWIALTLMVCHIHMLEMFDLDLVLEGLISLIPSQFFQETFTCIVLMNC